MYDVLLHELLALKAKLVSHGIPLMIGGGLGLYLREVYHPHERSPRYDIAIPVRSTQDIDVFLSADLIVDATAMDQIRQSLADLGYEPSVRYFQFTRKVDLYGSVREVKVDLLAAPPREEQQSAVKINKPRIRPRDAKEIHAYLTEEARSIERERIAIDLQDVSGEFELENTIVFIPSSYNYLILKLHAFDDRKDKDDDQSDRGRHHALDIFRIVIDMTEEDWMAAKAHYTEEAGQTYLQRACEIRRACFADEYSEGALRLRDTTAYRERRDEYDTYLPQFIEDLEELFP